MLSQTYKLDQALWAGQDLHLGDDLSNCLQIFKIH